MATSSHQTWCWLKPWSGRLRRPVSFAHRIRSSHRASVAKQVTRCPPMSVNRSRAPGWERSLRTITRIPAGQDDRSSRPVTVGRGAGVDRGHDVAAVPQGLRDSRHRHLRADHGAGRGVAQPVRAERGHARPDGSAADDPADGLAGQRTGRREHRGEHLAERDGRAAVPQPVRDRGADVGSTAGTRAASRRNTGRRWPTGWPPPPRPPTRHRPA
jgi:hypothetical protein